MADTAAFLAGCAVTGVAALFLLKNDLAISQPRVLQSPLVEPVVAPSQTSGVFQDPGQGWKLQTQVEQQQGIARDLTDQFRKQQSDTQDIKSQLEKQQSQSEDLRTQLEKQQRNTEQLIAQLQEQQRLIDKVADQKQVDPTALLRNDQSSGQIQTALWIGGGVILIILMGGGIVLIGVIVVVMMSSRRRQTRTVHVVHPVPTPYNFAEQPQLLSPARTRIKPPRQVDYYDE